MSDLLIRLLGAIVAGSDEATVTRILAGVEHPDQERIRAFAQEFTQRFDVEVWQDLLNLDLIRAVYQKVGLGIAGFNPAMLGELEKDGLGINAIRRLDGLLQSTEMRGSS